MTRAAAFALLALGAAFTMMVQLCPGASVASRHSFSIVFRMRLSVHVPPEESVINSIAMFLGKCCISKTSFATADPRFLTCHVIVPPAVPFTYVPVSSRSVTLAGAGTGVGVGLGLGVETGVGVGDGVGTGVGLGHVP
jgi:hypothetical protein